MKSWLYDKPVWKCQQSRTAASQDSNRSLGNVLTLLYPVDLPIDECKTISHYC